MKRWVIFDLETIKSSRDFSEEINSGWGEKVPDWRIPKKEHTSSSVFKMGFSLACTHDFSGTRFWDDPYSLVQYLLDSSIEGIVSYNGDRFDFPVLLSALECPEKVNGIWVFSDEYKIIYEQLEKKSWDLLKRVESSVGHRVSLDSLTQTMLGISKSISGEDFHSYWTGDDLGKRTTALNYLLGDVENLYKIFGCFVVVKQGMFTNSSGFKQKFDIDLSLPLSESPFSEKNPF